MPRIDALYHAFNVGQFDRDKLHRVDVEKMRLAAERQKNFLCDAVGRAFGRPGTEHLSRQTEKFRPLAFIAGVNQAAVLMIGDEELRVWDAQADALVSRVSVSTAITSGTFSSSTGWTLSSAAGQTTSISGGKLNLTARAHGAKAKASSSASVSSGDRTKEHALRIVVDRGPVTFKLGTSSGGAELIGPTSLRTGTHSLAFTPGTGNTTIYLEFSSEAPVLRIVDSCTIEAAGDMVLPAPWAAADIDLIREAQSLDVMYVACDGYKEQRIERRGDTSWSVVDEDRDDGPFQAGRSAAVTLTPSVLEGNGTLTASAPFFTAAHVGALFRLFHEGTAIDTYVAAENAFTQPFLVTGITETNFEERKYDYTIAGTWVGTIRNRRSFNGPFGDYNDFRRAQTVATVDITANASYTNDDNDDNIDQYVKIGFPPGLYTSGEAHITVAYQGGGGAGICRVVGFTDSQHVSIEVLSPFFGLGAVTDWRESRWDGYAGYPSAVAFDDGRLVWMGDDLVDASISDAYSSFDETFEGDAGPLSRSIALGGRNKAVWALPLSSLMIGCEGRIANLRASSLDEILTPDNFGVKSASKVGAAAISPAELSDDRAVFVQASGVQLYEITWSPEKNRYIASPFSKLTADMFAAGIRSIAVQTLPDQRMWVSTVDGDAVCIVFEPNEQILAAHVPIGTDQTGDYFDRFCALPGDAQDRVYVQTRRDVDGSTEFHLERFALDSEAFVGDICKVVDNHKEFGSGSATITGLGHLEGREVVAWVDGAPVLDAAITTPGDDNAKVFTVASGQITLPAVPAIGGVVGLAYDFQYKSARLAYGVQGYTPMLKNKGLAALGLLLADYCRSGVKYGVVKDSSFSTPWSLPLLDEATGTTAEEIVEGPGNDETPLSPGGELGLDVRVCIAGRSPKPLSMLALVLGVETY